LLSVIMAQLSSYDEKQKKAYVQHINNSLTGDHDLSYLPVNPDTNEIFDHVSSGILLSKLINKVEPGTVDVKKIKFHPKNQYECNENNLLSIEGAIKIGCKVVGIAPADLYEKKTFAFLGLVWQIIRRDLTKGIDQSNPLVQQLVKEGGDQKAFIDLSAEEIVLKWVNYTLQNAGSNQTVKKFSDLKDGEAYLYLIKQLNPSIQTDPLLKESSLKRLQFVIEQAKKMGYQFL